MEAVTIKASKRDQLGKIASKKIRSAGLVPAVVYGGDTDPVHVSVNEVDMQRAFRKEHGKNTIINLEVENGKSEQVITYIIKRDPIKLNFTHFDFIRVTDKPIKVTVPFSIEGTAPGQKMGGLIITKKDYLKLLVSPNNIPEKIVIDISNMQLGDITRIENISVESGTILDAPKDIIVKCSQARKSGTDSAAVDLSEESEEGSEEDSDASEGDSESNS